MNRLTLPADIARLRAELALARESAASFEDDLHG